MQRQPSNPAAWAAGGADENEKGGRKLHYEHSTGTAHHDGAVGVVARDSCISIAWLGES